MKDFKLCRKVSHEDFAYIKKWLYADYTGRNDGSGFYNNISDIEDDIDKRRILIYKKDGKAEAFLTFIDCDKKVQIQSISVNPTLRRIGVGKCFLNECCMCFKQKGYLIVDGYYVTYEGWRLAKSIGFKKVNKYSDSRNWIYKSLTDARKQNWNANTRLVMWKKEYLSSTTKPDFSWNLDFSRNNKPIIAYAHGNYGIGIVKDGKLIEFNKVKRFHQIDERSYDYIIVDESMGWLPNNCTK